MFDIRAWGGGGGGKPPQLDMFKVRRFLAYLLLGYIIGLCHLLFFVDGMGKHPDFMVAHPTPTIFRPLVEIFEISYFFAKNFEKVYTKTSTRRPTFGGNLPKVVNFGEKKTSRP